jgi:hypothetical protein
MTVTIPDRTGNPWFPVLRTINIPDRCPKCGGERGAPTLTRQCEDGEFYYVHTWTNPCGHIDKYADLIMDHTHA